MKFNPYIVVSGTAESAILRYAKAFNAEYQIMKYKDAPPNPDFKIPDALMELVLHGEVRLKDTSIMVCDAAPMVPIQSGNNVQVAITLDTIQELDSIFEVLSVDSQIIMEPQETFFAKKYVSFADPFGVTWQLIVSKEM